MTDVVNLNKFRKTKQKQAKALKAKENRILHGLTGAQKAVARAETLRAQVHLEDLRLSHGSEIKKIDDSQ